MIWIRMCQECGHRQKAQRPMRDRGPTDSYLNAKCRRCHSVALDFGRETPEPRDRKENA